jgi:uncharacterized protein YkwD
MLGRPLRISFACSLLFTACSDPGSGDTENASEAGTGSEGDDEGASEDGGDGDSTSSTGDGTTGDGDGTTGDGTTGDGTTGDGDGSTGDGTTGDGDGSSGDGDGSTGDGTTGDGTTGDGDGSTGDGTTGDGTTGDGDGTTGDGDGCAAGELGCSCFANNTCFSPLQCNGGICGSGDGDGTTGDGDGTTGDGDGTNDPYGPCPSGNDSECEPGETCVLGNSQGQDWSFCSTGTCQNDGQCDTVAGDFCEDLPGDGVGQDWCVSYDCTNMPCPSGMYCGAGFFGVDVCVWPDGGSGTTGDGDGDGDGDGTTGDGDGTANEVPNIPYCQDVDNWDASWSAGEVEVLNIVNQVRASGYMCASGWQPPAPPVTMNANLRCSARVHSKDMGDNNFFDHTSQTNGTNPGQRMSSAGYNWVTWSENIAAGNSGAQQTMNQWLGSTTGHCENLMSPSFDELGVGYYNAPSAQYNHYWTQNFGRQ